MERKLSLDQKKGVVEVKQPQAVTEKIEDVVRFGRLLNISYVNKKQLWQKVEDVLQQRDTATLKEILESKPLEHGLAEIVGYYDFLREKNGRVLIINNTTELIPLNPEQTKFVEVPYLLFTK